MFFSFMRIFGILAATHLCVFLPKISFAGNAPKKLKAEEVELNIAQEISKLQTFGQTKQFLFQKVKNSPEDVKALKEKFKNTEQIDSMPVHLKRIAPFQYRVGDGSGLTYFVEQSRDFTSVKINGVWIKMEDIRNVSNLLDTIEKILPKTNGHAYSKIWLNSANAVGPLGIALIAGGAAVVLAIVAKKELCEYGFKPNTGLLAAINPSECPKKPEDIDWACKLTDAYDEYCKKCKCAVPEPEVTKTPRLIGNPSADGR